MEENKYTGRQIAIFTDVHGLLQPLIAILEDAKKKGITEIYSLGDAIGLGPNPREVLIALQEYGVKQINGNSEEYTVLGTSPFSSYFYPEKQASQDWTYSQLKPDQISELAKNKHSYDLEVGGQKIALCHFANDVRIDFGKHSCWSYLNSINLGLNPNEQFLYTNSPQQKAEIKSRASNSSDYAKGWVSAAKDPIFDGKEPVYYDEIIQGHCHFKRLTEGFKLKVMTLRGAGIGYAPEDRIDFASYVVIREKEKGYDVEEVLIPYDRKLMLEAIAKSTSPDQTISGFVNKRK